MEPRKAHRRRLVIFALAVFAVAAFAFGAVLGDDSSPPSIPVAATLPAAQLAGQRIVAGLEGTAVTARLRQAIATGRLAGLVLFADNLPSRAAGRRLIARLQAIRRPPGLRDPLLIMVDQEGGLVKRLAAPPAASAREMGARGAGFAARQGELTAASLRALGINVDLAPVLDVARAGGTIAASDRGFGAGAGRVGATAIPFATALQRGGVAATAKHFPGLGAAAENTDFAVQRLDLSLPVVRGVDEAPYRAFVAAGGDMVMLSTAIYPALSPHPAAFARPVATGELRRRLGFAGVSITDALDTVAVRAFGGPATAAVGAADAGTDLLLFTDLKAAETASGALAAQLRSGRLRRGPFEDSVQRVLDLRRKLASRPNS